MRDLYVSYVKEFVHLNQDTVKSEEAEDLYHALIKAFDQLKARLLLQVHDELIFEAPKEEIEILEKLVPEVMEHALALDVPLKVDFASGPSWYDAK